MARPHFSDFIKSSFNAIVPTVVSTIMLAQLTAAIQASQSACECKIFDKRPRKDRLYIAENTVILNHPTTWL